MQLQRFLKNIHHLNLDIDHQKPSSKFSCKAKRATKYPPIKQEEEIAVVPGAEEEEQAKIDEEVKPIVQEEERPSLKNKSTSKENLT